MVSQLRTIKACGMKGKGSLSQGRLTHEHIIKSSLESDVFIGTTLVDMYSKCGSSEEAREVFYKLSNRNVVSWCAMIAGYARNGYGSSALELFEQMQQEGIEPNEVLFVCVLKACASTQALGQGRLVHDQIRRSEHRSNVTIGNTLVDMYAKCGHLDEARKVFDEIPNRNVVSWNVMIAGFSQHGCSDSALELFERMQCEGIKPDKVTFLGIIKACGNTGAMGLGKLIHDHLLRSGLLLDLVLSNVLIDMYAKCGSLKDAEKTFDALLHRDVVSWTALMLGHSQWGQSPAALELFWQMQQEGIMPSKVTFLCSLKACGNGKLINQCRVIHEVIIGNGFHSDVAIRNALIDTYAKCGSMDDARDIFDAFESRDEVSWSAMIAAYAQHGCRFLALELIENLQQASIKPDKVLFLCILKACGNPGAIRHARFIHDQISQSGFESDVMVVNTLIDMYVKCGSLKEAYKMFDGLINRDVVSWDAMIAGYTQHNLGLLVFALYRKMQQEGIKPDKVTFLCILKACCNIGSLTQGRLIHDKIIKYGFDAEETIQTTLINMYAKLGALTEACRVFDQLLYRDVVSWGAMIAGCVQQGHHFCALEMLDELHQEGIKPNKAVYTSALKACGSIGAIDQGRLIHEQVKQEGFESDVFIGNTLINMYARCGLIDEGHKVFDDLQNRDVVSWCAMITGYSQNADLKLALQFIEDMQLQALKPNGEIVANILAACSHAGRFKEGHRFFKCMREDLGITPSIEHYGCVVDLLGRAGYFHEAEDIIHTMPKLPDSISWTSLLSGCRTYGNMDVGRRCFDQVVFLDPFNASGYVLLSNIYADVLLWKDLSIVQELRKLISGQKKPGRAWIEVNAKLHEFIMGGENLLQISMICAKTWKTIMVAKDRGYVPQIGLVLEPVLYEKQSLEGFEKRPSRFGPDRSLDSALLQSTKSLQLCNNGFNDKLKICKFERQQTSTRT